jgi:hypothetical protein
LRLFGKEQIKTPKCKLKGVKPDALLIATGFSRSALETNKSLYMAKKARKKVARKYSKKQPVKKVAKKVVTSAKKAYPKASVKRKATKKATKKATQKNAVNRLKGIPVTNAVVKPAQKKSKIQVDSGVAKSLWTKKASTTSMKWVDTLDIVQWADRRDCQESIPHLVRKLIRATANSISGIRFPSGENVLIGGWDGVLTTNEGTEYIPGGVSVWEFGTNKDVLGKADEEYEKRTADPLGFDKAQCTFVFVTPRHWIKGDAWAQKRKKENVWGDVKVMNAEILDEWIETAPSVGAWLAIKYFERFPAEGIESADSFWDRWTAGAKYQLTPGLILGSRKSEQDEVFKRVGISCVIPVQGTSKEEALAFVIACFKIHPEREEDFFSRSLIVNNLESFKKLSIHNRPLILIADFDDPGVINQAVQKGHTVILPLGVESSKDLSKRIKLSPISRDFFVAGLIKSGMSREQAEKYSKETARNITILRRRLEFNRTLPAWAQPENVKDIIPALIVGRWDENFENDRIIISQIAGESYENYAKKLTRWLRGQDSPVVKIGTSWRLTSPLDSWACASGNITENDFKLFRKSAIEILHDVKPVFELPPKHRHHPTLFGKKDKYSEWISAGIVQSLILISFYEGKLQFDLPIGPSLWVDSVIAEVLRTQDPLVWKSLDHKLPLIAEASPIEFIRAIENQLPSKKSPITSLFDEDAGFLMPTSYYTGLLWALEGLAWFPEYLSRVALILSKLAAKNTGNHTYSNSPINSLTEIFKPWHYQTLAALDERMAVLKLISERERDVAWTLLLRMLPDPTGGIAQPTHKTRWRMFDVDTEKRVTENEIYSTYSAVTDLLISIFDYSELKLADLIKESVGLVPFDRCKVMAFIESEFSKVEFTKYGPWKAVRKILYHHRSHPDAPWALPENELDRYAKLYEVIGPKDEVGKNLWMFEYHWPEFPEGYRHETTSHENQAKIIVEKRSAGLTEIYSKYGIKKILELRNQVEDGQYIGDALSYVLSDQGEIEMVCELLKGNLSDIRFAQAFIFRKMILLGDSWPFDLYKELAGHGFGISALAQIFVPLNQTHKLWDFIESTHEELFNVYWTNMYPSFYGLSVEEKIYGLKKLIQVKRFFRAIGLCQHFGNEIPSEIIVAILDGAATIEPEKNKRLDGYEIGRLFEILDSRTDVDHSVLFRLEWLYLPLLSKYGTYRKPKLLHNELSRNPDFFMEVFKWIYQPGSDEKLETQIEGLTEEFIRNRAIQAYDLLHSWKKVPGVDENGNIDRASLNAWVDKVRNLAIGYGRIETADCFIGQVLAQYIEKPDVLWPPDEICELLERINTDSIKTNFKAATFNKRGSSTRAAFEGGDIERENARYYLHLASKQKNRFPVVTDIFERLARGYEEDAKSMDEYADRSSLDY